MAEFSLPATLFAILTSIFSKYIGKGMDINLDKIINYLDSDKIPPNHDLQKAIREAYLLSTIKLCEAAIDEIKTPTYISENDFTIINNIRTITENELTDLRENKDYVPALIISNEAAKLFIKTEIKPQSEEIEKLKNCFHNNLIEELLKTGIEIPVQFSEMLNNGWVYKNKRIFWFNLLCLLFIEIYKKNSKVNTLINGIIGLDSNEKLSRIITEFQEQNTILSKIDNRIDEINDNLNDLRQYFDNLPVVKSDDVFYKIPKFSTTNLIGRIEELNQIHARLEKTNEILLLKGIGGIGKSTLVYGYINDNKYSCAYDNLIYVPVANDDIKLSIIHELSGYLSINPDSGFDDQLAAVFQKLKNKKGNNLLILDGVNDINEIVNCKKDLELTGWKILIPTRLSLKDFAVIDLERLNQYDAFVLFYKYYNGEKNDTDLLAILEIIDYHPLLIVLLAKTLEANPFILTIKRLKEIIFHEGFDSEMFNVNIDINNRESTLAKTLRSIYSIGQLDDIEIQYLYLFSILPNYFYDIRQLSLLFIDLKEDKINYINAINNLEKKGWLIKVNNGIKCHLVIQEAVRTNLVNKEAYFQAFIERLLFFLASAFHITHNRISLDMIQVIESILNTTKVENSNTIQLHIYLSELYIEGSMVDQALRTLEKGVEISKKINDKRFSALCLLYVAKYEFELKKEKKKVLSTIDKCLGYVTEETKPTDKLEIFSIVSDIYSRCDNSAKAIEYSKLVIKILEKSNPFEDEIKPDYGSDNFDVSESLKDKRHEYLSSAYNIISESLLAKGDLYYSKALYYSKLAREIWEIYAKKDNNELAIAYYNTSKIFLALNETKNALESIEKAIFIRRNLEKSNLFTGNISNFLNFKEKILKYIDKKKPITLQGNKVGRNEPCSCGSGKKYKNCHGKN